MDIQNQQINTIANLGEEEQRHVEEYLDRPEPNNRCARPRRQRHTDEQIRRLEAAFIETQHPNERTRIRLSNELGLTLNQIKFWFQNRRTQHKNELEKGRLQALELENSSLKKELEELRSRHGDEDEDSLHVIGTNAGNELLALVYYSSLLWTVDASGREILDDVEYEMMFNRRPDQESRVWATRNTTMFHATASYIAHTIIKGKQEDLFPTIFSKSHVKELLPQEENSSIDGSLQLINAEINGLTPFMSTMELVFIRYCRLVQQQGTLDEWMIVDFHVDGLCQNTNETTQSCKLLPSGFIIQNTPHGYCEVASVQQVEISHSMNERNALILNADRVQRSIKNLIELDYALNGMPLLTMERQRITKEVYGNILSLSNDLTRQFEKSLISPVSNGWEIMYEEEDRLHITAMKRRTQQEELSLVCVNISQVLPISVSTLFNYLKDPNNRPEWDITFSTGSFNVRDIYAGSSIGREISYMTRGDGDGDRDRILQDSRMDEFGGRVVFASLSVDDVISVLNGAQKPAIVPSGFVILPIINNQHNNNNNRECEGCVLTVSCQSLSDKPCNALQKDDVSHIEDSISFVVKRINHRFGVLV